MQNIIIDEEFSLILPELASGTEDDVVKLVESIEDGTFVNRRPAESDVAGDGVVIEADGLSPEVLMTDAMESVASSSAGTQPWETTFTRITGDFHSKLRQISISDDTAAVRSALRLYIGMLEDLYREI